MDGWMVGLEAWAGTDGTDGHNNTLMRSAAFCIFLFFLSFFLFTPLPLPWWVCLLSTGLAGQLAQQTLHTYWQRLTDGLLQLILYLFLTRTVALLLVHR